MFTSCKNSSEFTGENIDRKAGAEVDNREYLQIVTLAAVGRSSVGVNPCNSKDLGAAELLVHCVYLVKRTIWHRSLLAL